MAKIENNDWHADAKSRIDLRNVIGQTINLTDHGDHGKGNSPLRPKERTASLAVYQDHFHDFGNTDFRGDIFDWLESEHGGGYTHADAILEVARLACINAPNDAPTRSATKAPHAPPTPRPSTPNPNWISNVCTLCAVALAKRETEEARNAWDYVQQRGLEHVATVLEFGVVDNAVIQAAPPEARGKLQQLHGRLIVPTMQSGTAVFFKARAVGIVPDAQNKYDAPKGSIPAPYNPIALEHASTQGFLILVEGEIDAASILAALDLEYPVIGLPGGNLTQAWAQKILETNATVYTLMDSDDAGAKHAVNLETKLHALGVRTRRIALDGYNDPNAALIALGADGLAAALETALEITQINHKAALTDAAYLSSAWLEQLDDRANRKHQSISTGLPALDQQYGSGLGEGLHVLGGITGGGKTSLAIQIAIHNARQGIPVIFATYEQSKLELWARIAAHITRIAAREIKRGRHNNAPVATQLQQHKRWADLEQIASSLRIVEAGDALAGTTTWTLDALERAASEMAEAWGVPPLVIVDYLQRVPMPDARRADPRERVGAVAGALQIRLARGIGCPVIALSSLGRATYDPANKSLEERLAAFKEAGELEYTAYTATLLYKVPDDKRGNLGVFAAGPFGGDITIPIAADVIKNREGEVGRVVQKWSPAFDGWADLGLWREGKDAVRHDARGQR
jgi:replicative DNA helicase